MSDDLDLDAIEARANAATPGPWTTIYRSPDELDGQRFDHGPSVPCLVMSPDCELHPVADASRNGTCADPFSWGNDAEFIAHARTNIPALVAEVRRLRAESDDQRRRIRDILLQLRRGDCWCAVGIGNPMMATHSSACVSARAIVDGASASMIVRDRRGAEDAVSACLLNAYGLADPEVVAAIMDALANRAAS